MLGERNGQEHDRSCFLYIQSKRSPVDTFGSFTSKQRDNIVTDIIYLKKYPLPIFMLYLYQTQLVLYKEV